jgi:hypothetical protein
MNYVNLLSFAIIVIFALIIFVPIAVHLYKLEKRGEAEGRYYVAKFHRNERRADREAEERKKRSLITDGH